MKKKSMVAALLFLAIPGSAQSPADLLQKGIYAQETAGDLDAAIQIFRQVANPSATHKSIAAQAQYQLVLCMLQRGDRPAAAKEVDTLAHNFSDQPDLVTKARKLLPGSSALLTTPWGESEASQLNIRKDGVATGDYLYYSIDPITTDWQNRLAPDLQALRWELVTRNSRRSDLVRADRNTGKVNGPPRLDSDDLIGDPAVEPLAGPAIDIQQSVFAIRRMPLAVGYKTKLTTMPLSLSHLAPKEVELVVAGIEPVEVTAGKFKCYKVSFASLGQTFWFGVEGSRPLVKVKSGNTEAELVKIWGPENFIETELSFIRQAGWTFADLRSEPGAGSFGKARQDYPNGLGYMVYITARKIYTPPADIPAALRDSLPHECRPETIQTRVIGGQQAMSCVVKGQHVNDYNIVIRSEIAAIELNVGVAQSLGVARWYVDQLLATAKRIP